MHPHHNDRERPPSFLLVFFSADQKTHYRRISDEWASEFYALLFHLAGNPFAHHRLPGIVIPAIIAIREGWLQSYGKCPDPEIRNVIKSDGIGFSSKIHVDIPAIYGQINLK